MKRVLELSSARLRSRSGRRFVNYEILIGVIYCHSKRIVGQALKKYNIFSGAALESPIVVGDQNKNLVLAAAVHT